MDQHKRQCGAPPSKRLNAFLSFLRKEVAGRRALADILDRHDDHWLKDVGLSRSEARRILKRSFIRRVLEWSRKDGR